MNVDTDEKGLGAGCWLQGCSGDTCVYYALRSLFDALCCELGGAVLECIRYSMHVLAPTTYGPLSLYKDLFTALVCQVRTCTFVAVYYEYAADYFGLQE